MAADLYDYWNLPIGPAASLLEGSAEPLAAKRWAVRALRRYWHSGRYQQLAASIMCDLGERAEGLAHRYPSSGMRVWAILSYEEFDLLDQLSRSLVADSTGISVMVATANSLPRENPVTVFLLGLVSH